MSVTVEDPPDTIEVGANAFAMAAFAGVDLVVLVRVKVWLSVKFPKKASTLKVPAGLFAVRVGAHTHWRGLLTVPVAPAAPAAMMKLPGQFAPLELPSLSNNCTAMGVAKAVLIVAL